jgi:hypothetical protein
MDLWRNKEISKGLGLQPENLLISCQDLELQLCKTVTAYVPCNRSASKSWKPLVERLEQTYVRDVIL